MLLGRVFEFLLATSFFPVKLLSRAAGSGLGPVGSCFLPGSWDTAQVSCFLLVQICASTVFLMNLKARLSLETLGSSMARSSCTISSNTALGWCPRGTWCALWGARGHHCVLACSCSWMSHASARDPWPWNSSESWLDLYCSPGGQRTADSLLLSFQCYGTLL